MNTRSVNKSLCEGALAITLMYEVPKIAFNGEKAHF